MRNLLVKESGYVVKPIGCAASSLHKRPKISCTQVAGFYLSPGSLRFNRAEFGNSVEGLLKEYFEVVKISERF